MGNWIIIGILSLLAFVGITAAALLLIATVGKSYRKSRIRREQEYERNHVSKEVTVQEGDSSQPKEKSLWTLLKENIREKGFWRTIKDIVVGILDFIITLHEDMFFKDCRLIEDLSAWVLMKRVYIVMENILLTVLFFFFYFWIDNYLGYYSTDGFWNAIKETYNLMEFYISEEKGFLLLIFIALWRSPRLTKIQPLKYYLQEFYAILFIGATFFVLIGIAYLFNISRKLEDTIREYPYIVTASRYGILFGLASNRHLYGLFYDLDEANEEKRRQNLNSQANSSSQGRR